MTKTDKRKKLTGLRDILTLMVEPYDMGSIRADIETEEATGGVTRRVLVVRVHLFEETKS